MNEYDIIVIGAGHAGCEAACAAANMGSKVLLVTMDMNKIAQMSCNPAIGGVAKGQIVREIDALGGFTGIVTDKSMIQFRMLNRSKGPAMWSPRAQCDRFVFSYEWRKIVENTPNVDMWQDTVTDITVNDNNICGIITSMGVSFKTKAVILTSGTFENGKIHIGKVQQKGGRIGERNSNKLSDKLASFGIEVGRMKTGTPARIDGRTIDFSVLEKQPGDDEGGKFSYLTDKPIKTNHSCYITYTNKEVHQILEEGFEDSPLFSGVIEGIGPRYCPSIEDKIVTFSSKDKHQLFLEPEGFDTNEYYINGFSSSLPLDVQYKALRKIKGLENVKIYRPGYAIEYDYYPPTQLYHTLESKKVEGLYFAGQVNGTTGYEEAAGQGLIAGINAHLKIKNQPDFILKRNESYIGVLIDDLVTKGVDEPYRMFTSRAEHRILLRQDNADERLTEIGKSIGLVSDERYASFTENITHKEELLKHLKEFSIEPNEVNEYLKGKNTAPLKQKLKLIEVIKRPQINLKQFYYDYKDSFLRIFENFDNIDEILEKVDIEIKYSGYIDREKAIAEKIRRLEGLKIPSDIDYEQFKSITIEARQKLSKIKPQNIGQASRIPGVSPSDINVLLIFFGR
ncbi:MAG: tRNA uridine-5-carboxymethylaminomethyl(34) synthesis enzyme MnmG [Bacteroidales bacterium]|nr:tRNA uridine-5-carboxymethylaminomethyl(34) synthesis enzyme MnmG [Bacteroidales bacterium]